MKLHRTVTDWTTDFDHYDPSWIADPFSLWREMRQRCDVARSERYGGVQFPLRWADVREVALDPETFSSRYVDIRDNRTLPPDFAQPLTSDPPVHRLARARLAPVFSALRVASLRGEMESLCRRLMGSIEIPSTTDVVQRYSRPASAGIVGHLLGLPTEDVIGFQEWDLARRAAFLNSVIADRRASLGSDLVSDLIRAAQVDKTLDEQRIIGSVFLVLIAGVDTTAAVISGGLLHLATRLQDQNMLREHPDCIAAAAEEFLRVFAPVVSARVATRDTEIAGCPMQAGEMVLLSFATANRDPTRFPESDQVRIDRANNNHAAFGMGVHHCLGAGLARQLLRISLEIWLSAVPAFRTAPNAELTWTYGSVRGLRSLPLVLMPRG